MEAQKPVVNNHISRRKNNFKPFQSFFFLCILFRKFPNAQIIYRGITFKLVYRTFSWYTGELQNCMYDLFQTRTLQQRHYGPLAVFIQSHSSNLVDELCIGLDTECTN